MDPLATNYEIVLVILPFIGTFIKETRLFIIIIIEIDIKLSKFPLGLIC